MRNKLLYRGIVVIFVLLINFNPVYATPFSEFSLEVDTSSTNLKSIAQTLYPTDIRASIDSHQQTLNILKNSSLYFHKNNTGLSLFGVTIKNNLSLQKKNALLTSPSSLFYSGESSFRLNLEGSLNKSAFNLGYNQLLHNQPKGIIEYKAEAPYPELIIPSVLSPHTPSPYIRLQSLSGTLNYEIPPKLTLKANYNLLKSSTDPSSADTYLDYVFKTTSFGIAYPLSRKLTLNGGYAVISSQGSWQNKNINLKQKQIIPSLGATYTFNTNTSITINYRYVDHQDKINLVKSYNTHQTSAEVKINF